jgi:biopolymer transport protein ExbD
LLKSFSTQGQLVTPASGLLLPESTVERAAKVALNVQIAENHISVEEKQVIDPREYQSVLQQKEFLITELFDVLKRYAEEGKKSAELFGQEFSGDISIQGDVAVPYNILTRVMYTCGQAGYPNMNLVVYRKE